MRTKTLFVFALLALAGHSAVGAEEISGSLPQQASESCLLEASAELSTESVPPELLTLNLDPTPALLCKSLGRSCQHDSHCCSGSCTGSGSNKTCA